MDNTFFFLMLLLLAMSAYYSFVVFPRQREYRKKQRSISELRIGDEAVTFGGIIGTVVELDAEQGVAQIEIAPGVVIRLLIAALMQKFEPQELALLQMSTEEKEAP